MKTPDNMNEEYLAKIISVAYGDASFVDEIKIYLDSKKNPEVKKILDEYKNTARCIRTLKAEEYKGKLPSGRPQVSGRVLSYLDIFIRKPVLSATMALMITAAVAGYYITSGESTTYNGYTKQELIVAERQAKESLAIVASIMNRTEDKLKYDIFGNKINKPIRKSLTVVDTYL